MKINRIKIQNFYSIQDLELNFDNYKGIVLIEGKNKDTGGSNGSGKSLILEAITWGLFGKTIRKSNEDAMVNFDAGEKCKVEILVNNRYTIKRSRRPTFLEVIDEERNETLTEASVAETQKVIEDILQTTFKVFSSSVIFGQHNEFDFLSANPDDKRTIIRYFLHLDDIFKWRDKIRGLKSEYSTAAKINRALIDDKIKQRDELQKHIEVEGGLKKDSELPEISLDKVLEVEGQIRVLNKEIRELEELKKDCINQELNLLKLIKEGVYSREEECPTCKQKYIKEVLPMHIDQYKASVGWLRMGIEQYDKNIKEKVDETWSLKPEISGEEYAKRLKFREHLSWIPEERKRVKDLQKEIEELEVQYHSNQTEYNVMKFWEKAFSEQGLIRYVIRNILKFFNQKCNYYLSILTSGHFIIEFDEELKEVITTGGRNINYISLSGGEKRKVNLAILLALQDILSLKNPIDTNIIFFDEIAENLDEDGINGLYILLTKLKKDKTIFVITHNEQLKSLMEDNATITMMKKHGVTRLAS